MEPISLISHRATLKKVASTPGTTNSPPQVAVTLVYPMTHETISALGALLAYVSHDVDTSLLARHFPAQPNPNDTPLDRELFRVQREHGQEERMRPLPGETCLDCAEIIAEGDEDAAFHVPLAGPPSPLCGACALKREAEAPADETDPASQSYCVACERWWPIPTGGLCEVCGGGTVSEAPQPDWMAIADDDGEPPADGYVEPGAEPLAPEDGAAEEPIGDRPFPERDGDGLVATTPIRRRK